MDLATCLRKMQYVGVLAFATVDEIREMNIPDDVAEVNSDDTRFKICNTKYADSKIEKLYEILNKSDNIIIGAGRRLRTGLCVLMKILAMC